jgi:hypothetical protein
MTDTRLKIFEHGRFIGRHIEHSRWVIADRLHPLETLTDIVALKCELSGAPELQQDRPIVHADPNVYSTAGSRPSKAKTSALVGLLISLSTVLARTSSTLRQRKSAISFDGIARGQAVSQVLEIEHRAGLAAIGQCLSLNFRAVAGLTRRCHSLPHGHLSVRYMATDKYRPHGHMDSDLFSGWRNTFGDVD